MYNEEMKNIKRVIDAKPFIPAVILLANRSVTTGAGSTEGILQMMYNTARAQLGAHQMVFFTEEMSEQSVCMRWLRNHSPDDLVKTFPVDPFIIDPAPTFNADTFYAAIKERSPNLPILVYTDMHHSKFRTPDCVVFINEEIERFLKMEGVQLMASVVAIRTLPQRLR